MASTPAPATSRQNNFNLIRLLFASAVLVSHACELIDGDRHREVLTRIFGTVSLADIAVDGFFIVSGYLIVQSWQRTPDLLAFGIKRVMRIYPGFIVASLLSALVVGPLAADPRGYFAAFEPLRFVGGIAMLSVPLVPAVFQGLAYPSVNAPMWTISYEFRCYAATALIGLAAVVCKRRWAGAVMASMAAVVLAALWHVESTIPSLRLLAGDPGPTLRLAFCFLAGAGYYFARHRLRYPAVAVIAAGAALVAGLFSAALAHVAVAVFGGYLIFGFAFARWPSIAHFSARPDISYGIYLYGWPVQSLLLWYVPGITPAVLFVASLVGAAACGWLSWTLVERPALETGKRLAARRAG